MNDITEIAIVADRSTSMWKIIDESRDAINDLINEQRDVEGYANLTFVMFSTEYEVLHDRVDIQKMGKIGNEYSASGMTALYDAIGNTINTIQKGLDDTPVERRADTIIVAIVTDGEENASKEFSHPAIAELIKLKESQGWHFKFLGANIDAQSVAVGLNIPVMNAMQYQATNEGTRSAYADMSQTFTSIRTSNNSAWPVDIKEDGDNA